MIKLLSFLILCYYSNHLVYLSHAFVTSTYRSSSSSSSSSSLLLLPFSRRRITKSSIGPRNDICIQNSVVLTSCNLSPPLSLLELESSSSSSILLSDITSSSDTTISSQTSDVLGLSTSTNIIIFIIGIIPFLWATYEFWSRIAVGASFGTGKDSIQIKPSSSNNDDDDENGMTEQIIRTIGKDNDLSKSRGRRVLGDDALFIAYVLFGIAIGSVGIAVFSVLTSTPPSNI